MNIPLVKAIKKILGYGKYIKYFVIKKRIMSFEPGDNVHHYSANTSYSLVEKKKIRELSPFLILLGLKILLEPYVIWVITLI